MTLATKKLISEVPKVILHEHLDGGLRPSTMVELAKDLGVELPTYDPGELSETLHRGAKKGSLPLYLEGFAHTIGVMQTKEGLTRIAKESILDFAADNVCYAEIRFHPGYHTARGLTLEDVMEAVLSGLEAGKEESGVEYGLIVCAMRNMDPAVALEMAELAVSFRDKGVVAFDLAGDESGHPPKRHIEAFHYAQRQNFSITIHAGESFGPESIWQAVQFCGAHRIGHATRLVDDMVVKDGKILKMGSLAQYILDKRIPLEICLLSNIHTQAAKSIEEHPFPLYWRYRFRVTVNTDNRLMSDTSATKELSIIAETWGLSLEDIERITINAMKSSFLPYKKRVRLIYDCIKPGYARVRAGAVDL